MSYYLQVLASINDLFGEFCKGLNPAKYITCITILVFNCLTRVLFIAMGDYQLTQHDGKAVDPTVMAKAKRNVFEFAKNNVCLPFFSP